MCGRYDLDVTIEELERRFGAPSRDVSVPWQPRYNMAPSQHNPVVIASADKHNAIEMMQWGLVPSWSKSSKASYSTINARAETLLTKPAYRKPLVSKRCLVPATGYFEWVQGNEQSEGSKEPVVGKTGKQPFRIRLKDEGLFAFAGLYDEWHEHGHGPEGDGLGGLLSYTIVTTQANSALQAFHSRMPVILPRDMEAVWLDPTIKDTERLLSLLQPYAEEQVMAYPVSQRVNSTANDGPHLIEAVA